MTVDNEVSFPFGNYKYPILDESDGVIAYRAEFPIQEESIFGIDVLIYPAESGFAENGWLFLVIDEATGRCLYHSEAANPKDAAVETYNSLKAQKRTERNINNYGGVEALLRLAQNNISRIFDGSTLRQNAGVCASGYSAFCQKHHLNPNKIVVKDALALADKDSRILLFLYHALRPKKAAQAA